MLYEVGIYHYFHFLNSNPIGGRGSTVGLLLLQCFRVGPVVEYSSFFILVLNLDLYVSVWIQ